MKTFFPIIILLSALVFNSGETYKVGYKTYTKATTPGATTPEATTPEATTPEATTEATPAGLDVVDGAVMCKPKPPKKPTTQKEMEKDFRCTDDKCTLCSGTDVCADCKKVCKDNLFTKGGVCTPVTGQPLQKFCLCSTH